MQNERRTFLKKAALLGAIALSGAPALQAGADGDKNNKEGEGFTFLFQGDSITDGNRTRDNDWNHVMGHGYAYIIASRLWYAFPEKRFHFFNRGISGNKLTDLAARWEQDTLNIQPNLLSILIGINDTAAFIGGDANFSADQFEKQYRQLLHQTKQQLPAVQLVICEPFILPVGRIKNQWQLYNAEIIKRQKIARSLATEFNALYVSLQDKFNEALKKAPAEYWIWDGIHPMPAGHELMAREWLKQVSKQLKFIRNY